MDTQSILSDESLTPEQKIEKLNKIILTMALEMDDLKNKGAGGGGLPPPPPGLLKPPPPPGAAPGQCTLPLIDRNFWREC